MRIIGGSLKGRRLAPPANLGIRPTTDMAREALFNILQHRVQLQGLVVLDLFGGSGAMSLEFLSRGAASVHTVELQRKVVQHLQRLRSEWKLEPTWHLHQADATAHVARQQPATFGLIFLDPPYAWPGKTQLLQQCLPLLQPHGLLILEHPTAEVYDHTPGFKERRVYGQSCFSFFGVEE